jgi:hypothetical protein
MAPGGANLLDSASMPLPSLLLWPVTALVGFAASYDVLATLGLALSAWAAHFALRRLGARAGSAWLGGAVYGFGGYMAGEATAHANLLVAAIFPPVAAILLMEVGRRRSPSRIGVLLGLCAAAQLFVDEEILATAAIMAAIALLVAALAVRPPRALVERYAKALLVALAVFALLAGWAIGYQLLGPEHIHGRVVTAGRYVNVLASFVVPSSVNLLSTAGSRHLAAGFSGYDGELGGYLGAPLIAVLLYACWRLRRRALLPAVLLLCAALFSLGPHLRVGGHDTGILLPWVIPNHLPLLEDVVPDRFNLYVWLAAGALIALLLDDLRRRPPLGSRALAVAVIAVGLVPALPTLTPSEVVRLPSVLTSAPLLHRYAPAARTVLVLPSSAGQLGMFAQAKAGFAYTLPDGGVFVPGAGGPSYGMREGPLLYALAAVGGYASTSAGRTPTDTACLRELGGGVGRLGPRCRAHYRNALRALGVGVVVVCERGSPAAVARYARFFAALLGPPRSSAGAEVFVAEAASVPPA